MSKPQVMKIKHAKPRTIVELSSEELTVVLEKLQKQLKKEPDLKGLDLDEEFTLVQMGESSLSSRLRHLVQVRVGIKMELDDRNYIPPV